MADLGYRRLRVRSCRAVLFCARASSRLGIRNKRRGAPGREAEIASTVNDSSCDACGVFGEHSP
eukprot:3433930-Rhodomonas_salina.1